MAATPAASPPLNAFSQRASPFSTSDLAIPNPPSSRRAIDHTTARVAAGIGRPSLRAEHRRSVVDDELPPRVRAREQVQRGDGAPDLLVEDVLVARHPGDVADD